MIHLFTVTVEGGEERSASLLLVVRISYSRNERWDGEIRLLREVRGLLLIRAVLARSRRERRTEGAWRHEARRGGGVGRAVLRAGGSPDDDGSRR